MTRPNAGRVIAVLGPTNTGKTHLALERMMARASGVMGLPLRLLARELYDKVVKAKGVHAVALITGEEKIRPPGARYFLCTVEAMPMELRPAFLGVDEIQLASDPDRGHIFTDRLLHARGTEETMFMGAGTMRPLLRRLVPEAEIDERERFSVLTYAGSKKLSKLPRRSAVVAFSAEDVYSIAELVRRQRGGAAVVMGALSPRTRNSQVELYQSGEVDFLIATDAIGMGLNMDVDHVAFAALNKFDGRKRRKLFPHEIGQIAGRAGRFRSDGTFGETADAKPLEADVIARVENHEFAPVDRLTWRNSDLDLSSLHNLRITLNMPSPDPVLERVRYAIDEEVLDIVARDAELKERIKSRAGLTRLWDVCRTPDFRKTTIDDHARLIKTVFGHLTSGDGFLPDSWLEAQITRLAKTSGDVDALSQRLAHVRTWAYAAHRSDWTRKPEYWQDRTREVEDQLSDALHERLTARFIDRRTSALMKGLREQADMEAGLAANGEVTVEGHFVGRLSGFTFKADTEGGPLARRAVANAALKAVRPEVNRRLGRLAKAEDAELTLADDGAIFWSGDRIAHMEAGSDPFAPGARLIGGELGAGEAVARAERRLERFIAGEAEAALEPLLTLRRKVNGAKGLDGLARGIGYRLVEGFGAAPRSALAQDIAQLSVAERRQLKSAGVRIGEHSVFLPALVKPRPARLSSLLKAAHTGAVDAALLPEPGRTSMDVEPGRAEADYGAAGFQRCGPRAVRLDMLERLADLIREARDPAEKHAFAPSQPMMSLLGCSEDELKAVLRALGYKRVRKAAGTGDNAQAELWGGRARSVTSQGAPPPAPAPSNTPFAILAELPVARPAPASQTPQAPGQNRRRKARAKAKNPAGPVQAAPSPGPTPASLQRDAASEPARKKPRRRRRRGKGSTPSGDAS
jgi:ATP-dependent RNA helicase SUPV3L1/SUV3